MLLVTLNPDTYTNTTFTLYDQEYKADKKELLFKYAFFSNPDKGKPHELL